MADILIIDDEKTICEILARFVFSLGHQADYARTLAEGLHKASAGSYDIIILDVRLPDGDGLGAIPEIRSHPQSPEIIIITGEGSPDGARMALQYGAWDYIQKPVSLETIRLPLARALQYREGKGSPRGRRFLQREQIIGNSPPINDCLGLVARAGEVSQGIEQINRAVGEVEKIIQRNAADAEESTVSAAEMKARMVELNDVVSCLMAWKGDSASAGNG